MSTQAKYTYCSFIFHKKTVKNNNFDLWSAMLQVWYTFRRKEPSTKSNGKRRCEMKIYGSKQDRNQRLSRYCGGSGAGSDTPSGSQHPAPHDKPWPGTCRGREREAGLATVGGKTLKQSWNSKGPTGPEWPQQPRTQCDGEGLLMAYAPGVTGISKYYIYIIHIRLILSRLMSSQCTGIFTSTNCVFFSLYPHLFPNRLYFFLCTSNVSPTTCIFFSLSHILPHCKPVLIIKPIHYDHITEEKKL